MNDMPQYVSTYIPVCSCSSFACREKENEITYLFVDGEVYQRKKKDNSFSFCK